MDKLSFKTSLKQHISDLKAALEEATQIATDQLNLLESNDLTSEQVSSVLGSILKIYANISKYVKLNEKLNSDYENCVKDSPSQSSISAPKNKENVEDNINLKEIQKSDVEKPKITLVALDKLMKPNFLIHRTSEKTNTSAIEIIESDDSNDVDVNNWEQKCRNVRVSVKKLPKNIKFFLKERQLKEIKNIHTKTVSQTDQKKHYRKQKSKKQNFKSDNPLKVKIRSVLTVISDSDNSTEISSNLSPTRDLLLSKNINKVTDSEKLKSQSKSSTPTELRNSADSLHEEMETRKQTGDNLKIQSETLKEKNNSTDKGSRSKKYSIRRKNSASSISDSDKNRKDESDSDEMENENGETIDTSPENFKVRERYDSLNNDQSENDTDDEEDDIDKDNRETIANGYDSNSDMEHNDDAESGKSSESEIFQQKRKKRKRSNSSEENSEKLSEDSEKKEKKTKRKRRIKRVKDSDSSDNDDKKDSSKKRKNIRKLLKDKDLEDDTKRAAREEHARKKRIEERQKLYNQMYDEEPEKVKELDKLVLDFDDETKEEYLRVDSTLVKKLKPHQANGVKFMWDASFETLKRMESSPGSGCILAHCMGLGKTLQVVTLIHTLLTHSDKTKVSRVLVICPLSTVLNWVNEFNIWLQHVEENNDIDIYEISKFKQNNERANIIKEWHTNGGVLVLGYDMFRNLTNETGNRIKKKARETLQKSLVNPGPELVICDEGHLLKNEKTSLSKAVNRINTLRRIVLTGTPLQNNLKEYYCMVQFVKPNLLGKYTEYLNRFVNPITNGQYIDSTPRDIEIMKKRSHVLHKMLDGCVQRRDYGVLAPFLPPKHEYVVFIRLTKLQIELYKFYMENVSNKMNAGQRKSAILFADFQNLQRIWTHPRVLRYNSDRYEINQQKKRDQEDSESEGSLKDFIDDESDATTSDSDGSEVNSDSNDSKKNKNFSTRRTRSNAAAIPEEIEEPQVTVKDENPTEWWMPMVPEEELDNIKVSGKLTLLFSILQECETIGDKLLVFSQSLYSLDVIEHFLSLVDENVQANKNNPLLGGFAGSWSLGLDYFRLDGSTSVENRNIACKAFNRTDNPRARLFLISTRAGGLGINLVAANRVIIFDASWNPSHDVQSIFRVYRFGQEKPCYIYRFCALGTMEEKIYERQVTKQAISKRVIDEQQIDRHYRENDLMELYNYDLEQEKSKETPNLPKDRLFAELLKNYDDLIYKYHEHDSLLENKEEETLNEEERRAAWEEFEAEKKRPVVNYNFNMGMNMNRTTGPVTSNTIFGFRTDVLLRLLTMKAQQEHPTFTDMQIKQVIPFLLQSLYQQMANGDRSLLTSLILLQHQLETPSYAGINPLMFGGIGGDYSSVSMNPEFINPYALPNNMAYTSQQMPQVNMQQQDLIKEAQDKFMNPNQNVPAQNSNEIIELE